MATSVSFTGGGVGLMLPLREVATNMQFPSRHGYIYLILAFVLLALAVTAGAARASAPICRPCATTRTRRAPSASIRCA